MIKRTLIIVLTALATSNCLVGMQPTLPDPYDNGKIHMSFRGCQTQPTREIDLVRESIRQITENLSKMIPFFQTDTKKIEAWKSLEETFNTRHCIDLKALETILNSYTRSDLSHALTFFTIYIKLYSHIRLINQYLLAATQAEQRFIGTPIDVVLFSFDRPNVDHHIAKVQRYIPEASINIQYLDNPAQLAEFLTVKEACSKSKSTEIFFEKLKSSADSSITQIKQHAIFELRHYYIQNAYAIFQDIDRLTLNMIDEWIDQLQNVPQTNQATGKPFAEQIRTDVQFLWKNDPQRGTYRRLLEKNISPLLISSVINVFAGYSFDCSRLLDYANRIRNLFSCHVPENLKDFAMSAYLIAYDNKMRPQQRALEKELHLYCEAFDAKKVFYQTIYQAIYQRLRDSLPKNNKSAAFKELFKLTNLLPERLKHHVIANDMICKPSLSFDDTSVTLPTSWLQKPVLELRDQPAARTSPATSCTRKKKKSTAKKAPAKKKKSEQPAQQSTEKSKPEQQEQPTPAPAICTAKTQKETPLVIESTELLSSSAPIASLKQTSSKKQKNLDPDAAERQKWQLDWRIDRWWKPSFTAYQTPENIRYHAFPLCIDRYLRRHGFITKRPNNTRHGQIDTVYTLPGEVQIGDNRSYAIYSCTVDPNHICYHRGMETTAGNNLLQEFGHWALDVNTVHENKVDQQPSDDWKITPEEKKRIKRSAMITKHQGYIDVEDHCNNMHCIVYLLNFFKQTTTLKTTP